MKPRSQLDAWLDSPEFDRAVRSMRVLANRLKPHDMIFGPGNWETRMLRSAAIILINNRACQRRAKR